EGASAQRLLRAGKLLLERQPLRAFGGHVTDVEMAPELISLLLTQGLFLLAGDR
ncbi:hypothetical protein KUCAC02_012384, partial [Chaenocephalus aceratus]